MYQNEQEKRRQERLEKEWLHRSEEWLVHRQIRWHWPVIAVLAILCGVLLILLLKSWLITS